MKHNICVMNKTCHRYLRNLCFIIVMKELELQSYGTICGSRNPSIAVVNMLWAARPRNRGSIPQSNRRFISCPKRADRLWDPSSVLLSRNHGLFSRGQMSGSRNLLLPSSVVVGISGALTYSHIRLPGMHRKNFQVLYV